MRRTRFRAGAAFVVLAGLIGFTPGRGEEVTEGGFAVAPDRLSDVPTGGDPFASAATFAWRAFIALNWPARVGESERGAPDRGKAFGDPG